MYRKLADTIYLDFTVHLPTTGAVSDADELPTVEVFEDATDATLSGATVVKRVDKTGNYRVAVVATTGNGFEVGKSYNVVITVIAGTITAKAVVGSFFIDSKRLADLNDLGGTAQTGDAYAQLGAAGAGLTALGDTRIANLDAAVSTRSTLTAQQVWEYATRTLSSFGTLVADIWSYATRTLSSFGTLAADVWAVGTRALTDKAGFTISGAKTTLDALQDPTVGAIADQVWDEAIASHLDAGSTGNALNAAGSAGDPWSTPIPGAYGAGTAGKIVGDNINAPIATVDTVVDAIKAKTDNLPTDPADESLVIAATDSIMTRLGLPAGASLAADLVTIDNLVDDLESRLSAARAGYLDELGAANIPADIDMLIGRLTAARAGYLDNLSGGAVALEAQVQTHAAAALAAYDPPTKAEMDAALAALNDITVAEILAGSLADGVSFPANTLADLIRKVFWMVANKMVVVDATGAYTLYKTDGMTPAATGSIVDDLTNTTRSEPAWP